MWTFSLICSKDPERRSACCYLAKCASISSWCVYFPRLKLLSAIFILSRSCSHWSFRIRHIYKGAFYKTILKCCMNIISFIFITPLWGRVAHIILPIITRLSVQMKAHKGFLESSTELTVDPRVGRLGLYMNFSLWQKAGGIILSTQENNTFLSVLKGRRKGSHYKMCPLCWRHFFFDFLLLWFSSYQLLLSL